MIFDLTATTPPVGTPVTLEQAKTHLRVEGVTEDAYITGLLEAATATVEDTWTWRALLTRTYSIRIAAARTITLPMPPVASITTVTTVDADGGETVLAAADYRLTSAAGILRLATEPAAGTELVIVYVAGYGAAAVVPAQFKQAILLLVGHWYENREAVVLATQPASVPHGVESLTRPWKAYR